jgi:hypothetical protein
VSYRTVGEITEDEFLSYLTDRPQHQIDLFVQMGGDPNDHNYARLSFLTKSLRRRGEAIQSCRRRGVWLGESV